MKGEIANGEWALLTGASRGIGLELARGLAARGYSLVLVARGVAGLNEARESLLAEGAKEVVTIAADLTAEGAAQSLYEECRERSLEVEVLVNNAGMFIYRNVCDVESERVSRIIGLHVTAATELCRLFGRDMCERGRGYILNISSYASWLPLGGLSLYAATKAYLREFSYALRDEVIDRGVRVSVATPAGVATDLYGLPERYQRVGLRLGVLLSPEKVAQRCLRGVFRGRRRVALGVMYRVLIPLLRHLPKGIKRWVRKKNIRFSKINVYLCGVKLGA